MSASTPNTGPERLHVAVGVVRNRGGDVLIARRADQAHQGGLWEFPGGKREAGEPVREALRRELEEELGIQVESAAPFLQVRHRYPGREVLLDVWEVTGYRGEPAGREGQPLAWVAPRQLCRYPFPPANRPILNRLALPPWYAVMEGEGSVGGYLDRLHRLIEQGIGLIYLRARDLSDSEYRVLIRACSPVSDPGGAVLMRRDSPSPQPLSRKERGAGGRVEASHGGWGLHLSAGRLAALSARPEGWRYVAAACHDREDLLRAEALGLDFAVLSPVRPTLTHPRAKPLGWSLVGRWLAGRAMPVYVMGGLERRDLTWARRHGAQGVAGIRLFVNG